ITDPEMGRLKEAYESSWYTNQLLFDHGAPALNALRRAEVETLVLKGAALSGLYYRDAGARPMEDVDVAVTAADAPRAIATLRALGWRPEVEPTAAVRSARHSVPFSDGRGAVLDLHWRILWQPRPERSLWAASRRIVIG